jgi:Recombinase
LVYRTDGTISRDPDVQVQHAIRLVFETFERTGSAVQTVRFFQEQGLMFPRRLRTGPNKGDLRWASPQHARILQVLHNPRYAGAFAYGRTRIRHRPDGGTSVVKVARADWQFVMPGMHQGYIDWDRFEANQRRLADNARAFGGERRSGQRARDRRCSKVACCVVCVANAWVCTTARTMAARSQPTSVGRPRCAGQAGPVKRFRAR